MWKKLFLMVYCASEVIKSQSCWKIDFFWWIKQFLDRCVSIHTKLNSSNFWYIWNDEVKNLVKWQWSYRKTLCRSLVICKGFFRMTTVIWQFFQFSKEIWYGNLQMSSKAPNLTKFKLLNNWQPSNDAQCSRNVGFLSKKSDFDNL